MKKVAVTGGLASGKTSVCQILERLGAYVVSSDRIVHQLLSIKSKIGQEVIALLGDEIISQGDLDRTKIAKKVFSQPEKLRTLEKIIHPAVINEIENQYRKISKNTKYSLFVAEIPLLYESENQHLFDHVIAVIADANVSRKRFQEKTQSLAEEFDRRMSQQLNPEEKAAHADFIISNNGTFSDLETSVRKLYQQLVK